MSAMLRLIVACFLVILSIDFGKAFAQKELISQVNSQSQPYIYYEVPFEEFWIDLHDWEANNINVHKVDLSAQRWERDEPRVKLNFQFPFYGKVVKDDITIRRNDGTISFGWELTSSIVALNASVYRSRFENDSYLGGVIYADNGTCFVVKWMNIYLGEHGPFLHGSFWFQLILKDTGDIIFVYKFLPFIIMEFPGIQTQIQLWANNGTDAKQKLDLLDNSNLTIESQTAIYIKALQLCEWQTSCEPCLDLPKSYTRAVIMAVAIVAGLAIHLIICGCLIKSCKNRRKTAGHLRMNLKLGGDSVSKLIDHVEEKQNI